MLWFPNALIVVPHVVVPQAIEYLDSGNELLCSAVQILDGKLVRSVYRNHSLLNFTSEWAEISLWLYPCSNYLMGFINYSFECGNSLLDLRRARDENSILSMSM